MNYRRTDSLIQVSLGSILSATLMIRGKIRENFLSRSEDRFREEDQLGAKARSYLNLIGQDRIMLLELKKRKKKRARASPTDDRRYSCSLLCF